MKALVTGSSGFVGKYLSGELRQNGYDVIGIARTEREGTIAVNLLDKSTLNSAVRDVCPDIIIHLAGQANVGASWKIPAETFQSNVIATINLLEAAREFCPNARIVLVGSSDEYGSLGKLGISVSENTPVNPQTPYAISKRTQEELGVLYAKAYNMNICMTRSFNHYGVGQKEGFIIPDFASGIVRVEKGLQPCVRVGNLSSQRDFTHVRDVVRAYRLIAEKGKAGEIYNVGSGTTYSASDILNLLLALSDAKIAVEQDPSKLRPSDTPVICCDHSKLTRDTGWNPSIRLEDSLKEIIESRRINITV